MKMEKIKYKNIKSVKNNELLIQASFDLQDNLRDLKVILLIRNQLI